MRPHVACGWAWLIGHTAKAWLPILSKATHAEVDQGTEPSLHVHDQVYNVLTSDPFPPASLVPLLLHTCVPHLLFLSLSAPCLQAGHCKQLSID